MGLDTTEQLCGIQPIHLGKDFLHKDGLHILENELAFSFLSHHGINFRAQVEDVLAI
jgi:hypothetical protein